VIIELSDDGSAIVTAIEVGFIACALRLHPFLGRCARALEAMLGLDTRRPVRIPFALIVDFENDVKVDVASMDTPVLAVEQKARRIVSSIPGA
jgi:hypothetical protein